ncbi:MAG: hypothetical protein ACKV19_00435 [Verrucomicrobiales bacterium]
MEEPIHLTTGLPRARMNGWRLMVTAGAHLVLLIIAAIWVISTTIIPSKESQGLVFTTERPSVTANGQKGEHAAKLVRKKVSSGAPPNARRLTSSVSKAISLPSVPATAITDFQPGVMGGGMGTGLGGFGTGAGIGGPMGTGSGGGRIKFFGFETDGDSIILAIDTSGSMYNAVGGESGISVLRSEISRTIDMLPVGALFNIICFGQDADAAFAENVLATRDTKAAAKEFMEGYYGAGGFGRTRTETLRQRNEPVDVRVAELDGVPFAPLTVDSVQGLEGTTGSSRMDLALVAAMERQASTIFLLSDGQPSAYTANGSLSKDEILKVITDHHKRLYRNKPLVIHTIYTNTDRKEEAFMQEISKHFKGKHKDVQLN